MPSCLAHQIYGLYNMIGLATTSFIEYRGQHFASLDPQRSKVQFEIALGIVAKVRLFHRWMYFIDEFVNQR